MKKLISILAVAGAAAGLALTAPASAAPVAHRFVYAGFAKLSMDRLNQLAGNGWVLVSGHVSSHRGAVEVDDVLLQHTAPLSTAAKTLSAASASAASKPAWLHVGHVRHYGDCHGAGVIVWQSHGNTSALHCRNGKTFLS